MSSTIAFSAAGSGQSNRRGFGALHQLFKNPSGYSSPARNRFHARRIGLQCRRLSKQFPAHRSNGDTRGRLASVEAFQNILRVFGRVKFQHSHQIGMTLSRFDNALRLCHDHLDQLDKSFCHFSQSLLKMDMVMGEPERLPPADTAGLRHSALARFRSPSARRAHSLSDVARALY